MERQPTPVFWPGEFHGLHSPRVAKNWTQLSDFHFHFTLGCFHVLIIVNKAAMKMKVHISLQGPVFSSSGHIPGSGIAESYSKSILIFWDTTILFSTAFLKTGGHKCFRFSKLAHPCWILVFGCSRNGLVLVLEMYDGIHQQSHWIQGFSLLEEFWLIVQSPYWLYCYSYFLILHDTVLVGFLILRICLFHLGHLICWDTIGRTAISLIILLFL